MSKHTEQELPGPAFYAFIGFVMGCTVMAVSLRFFGMI